MQHDTAEVTPPRVNLDLFLSRFIVGFPLITGSTGFLKDQNMFYEKSKLEKLEEFK